MLNPRLVYVVGFSAGFGLMHLAVKLIEKREETLLGRIAIGYAEFYCREAVE
jgi:hypothetical protein